MASDGTEGNGTSYNPSISADGRCVAFDSRSSNLVPGDTNGERDVFVRDRYTGTTERVSVASDGTEGNSTSSSPSISADGRYVAFSSSSSNLVPGDTNGMLDVFVHDRHTGTTERVSVTSVGNEFYSTSFEPSISADGRYVAFSSRLPDLVWGGYIWWHVYVHDRHTGTTERVSVASDGTEGNDHSSRPSISADGRYVAFDSWSSNLVPGDTNGALDVFVRDRHTGTTERVSVASDGTEGNSTSGYPSISADGRHVAFHAYASNLVPGDTNLRHDVFVHDRHTGTTERVSVASDGRQGKDTSQLSSISADGRYVGFESDASNLVPGDTNGKRDVFVHDRHTGTTERVSVAADGTEGDGLSWGPPSISADGRYVAFESIASNLVPDDTNGTYDVFVHDRKFGQPSTIDIQHDAAGVVFDRWVTGYSPVYSGDGYVYGRWTGTELTARFTGTKIRWVGPKQPSYGMADVYIDGVRVAENVDCYAPAGSATLESLIWESGTLSDGPHTISIRLKGNRNASSTGNVVVLDRFEVDGAAPQGGGFRIDDAAAAPGYTGNWISAINPTYYDKTYSYSRWAGHAFSVTFNGTKVAWLGPMTPFYGTAEIWLDGSYVTTVDAYRSYQGWRERIWESGTLAPGTHTLEIRPTGEKNPASTSANVVIDAIDVTE